MTRTAAPWSIPTAATCAAACPAEPGVPVTAARRDPRARLHRQRQPTRALPQPGPRPRPAGSPAPRRLVSWWLMTRPVELPHDRGHLEDLLASCPHLTVLAEHVRADRLGGLLHEYVQVARRDR